MKRLSATLLALVFAFFSLLSLISVKPSWEQARVQTNDSQERISELGLRFGMGR